MTMQMVEPHFQDVWACDFFDVLEMLAWPPLQIVAVKERHFVEIWGGDNILETCR